MVHIHSGIVLSNKKDKIVAFAATWIQLEILILSEIRQISFDITYMWNLKYGTNEPIHRNETDSQAWKTDLWLPRGRGRVSSGLVGANYYI